jgi:hypothetical protein
LIGVVVIRVAAADDNSPDSRPVSFILFLLGKKPPAYSFDGVLRSNKTSRDESQSHDWDDEFISEDRDATLRLVAKLKFDQPGRAGKRTM